MAELSDFSELKEKDGHVMITTMDDKVGQTVFGTSWEGNLLRMYLVKSRGFWYKLGRYILFEFPVRSPLFGCLLIC